MVMRKPIVRIGGRNQQLPVGDVLAGVVQRLPVFQTDTAAVLIELIAGSTWTWPVYDAAGVAVQVGL